jgi:hypothetical protein
MGKELREWEKSSGGNQATSPMLRRRRSATRSAKRRLRRKDSVVESMQGSGSMTVEVFFGTRLLLTKRR